MVLVGLEMMAVACAEGGAQVQSACSSLQGQKIGTFTPPQLAWKTRLCLHAFECNYLT